MLKKILSYGFIEGIAKGLNKLILLILPFFLDTFNYGKVGLLISIELLMPFISLLGLERAVLRFYSEKELYSDFSRTISLSVTYIHVLMIGIYVILYLLGIESFWGLDIFPDLILITILVYFTGINLITLNMLRVNEEHGKYSQSRLYLQISKFVLVLLFVFLTKDYIGYLIGAIIAAISVNVFFKVKKVIRSGEKNAFNGQTFLFLFSFSWPFIFHGISANLLGNADKFVLEHYMSMEDVGLYTLIYSIGSSMMFAYIGVSVYLEPTIYKEKDERKREILLNKYLIISLILGLLAFVMLSIFSEYILPHFYNDKYRQVFPYISFIALSFLIYPFYLKSNYKMIYERRSLTIAILSTVSCIFNIGLNIYLIPIYGIYAAVITTLASYMLQALLFTFFANKRKINKELFCIVVLSLIVYVSISFQIMYYYNTFIIIFYIWFLKKKYGIF